MASQKLTIPKGSPKSWHGDLVDSKIKFWRQFEYDFLCKIKNSGPEAKLRMLKSLIRVPKVSGMLSGLAKLEKVPDSVALKNIPPPLSPRTLL